MSSSSSSSFDTDYDYDIDMSEQFQRPPLTHIPQLVEFRPQQHQPPLPPPRKKSRRPLPDLSMVMKSLTSSLPPQNTKKKQTRRKRPQIPTQYTHNFLSTVEILMHRKKRRSNQYTADIPFGYKLLDVCPYELNNLFKIRRQQDPNSTNNCHDIGVFIQVGNIGDDERVEWQDYIYTSDFEYVDNGWYNQNGDYFNEYIDDGCFRRHDNERVCRMLMINK